jgi:hypothetical protein
MGKQIESSPQKSEKKETLVGLGYVYIGPTAWPVDAILEAVNRSTQFDEIF